MNRSLCIIAVLLMSGCASGPKDPGVPKEAGLVAEITGPAGARSNNPSKLEAETGGALYVFDVGARSMIFSGAVEPGQVILLYESGVGIVGKLPSKMSSTSRYERRVAYFNVGATYRVYFQPGVKPTVQTPELGSPLTKPFEERERKIEKR